MKWFLCLISIIVIASCGVVNKKLSSDASDRCLQKLDTLKTVMEHSFCGVYYVDLDYFPIAQYEDMSDAELRANNLPSPRDEKKLRIYEFKKYLQSLKNDTDCFCIWNEKILFQKIGSPHNQFRNGYTYKFNIGDNCPSLESVKQVFEGCLKIVFTYGHRKCIDEIIIND